jgi:hypothetical protein
VAQVSDLAPVPGSVHEDLTPVAGSVAANPDLTPAAGTVQPDVEKIATKYAAGGLKNLLHAGQGVMETIEAPARAVAGSRSYIDAHPGDYAGALGNAAKFALDPKKQDETGKIVRAALSPSQGGFIPTDTQINAHLSGWPATVARSVAQGGAEVLADPLSAAPVGPIGKAVKLIPGAVRASEGIGKVLSPLFNAEHHLSGLTEHGQNVVESIRNVAKQGAEQTKRAEDLAISQGRKAIRAGQLPPDVAAAFAKYGAKLPEGAKGKDPAAFMEALDEARAAHTQAGVVEKLKAEGLHPGTSETGGPTGELLRKARGQDKYFKSNAADDVVKAREGILKHIAPEARSTNLAARAIEKTNSALKTMFLTVPIPHVANLTNLAYNKYGLATTLRGLMYAAQEATGKRGEHLKQLVGELQKIGADNQYSKLYSETTRFKPLHGVQRFANKAQDKVLNPVERGLRAAGLEAEQKAGKQGVDAARGLHKAFGSDADTALTKFLTHNVPLSSFPRFHTQTSLGSFGRTLADKPGRITGYEHMFGGGPDRKPSGSGKRKNAGAEDLFSSLVGGYFDKNGYHLTTPTATGLNAANNPLGSLLSPASLGGLSGVTNPYSFAGAALEGIRADAHGKRGKAMKQYEKAVRAGLAPLIPAPISAAYEMARGK